MSQRSRVFRVLGSDTLGIPAMLRAQGFTAGTRVISTRVVESTDDVAAALAIAPRAPVVVIERVRLADGRPLSWETMCVSLRRFPDLPEQSVSGSLWDLFERRYGVTFADIVERVRIVLADQRYAP